MAKSEKEVAWVYVIEIDAWAIKIGLSKSPWKRIGALQTGQQRDLALRWSCQYRRQDAVALERAIHKRLKGKPCHAKGEIYYLDHHAGIRLVEAVAEAMGIMSLSEFEMIEKDKEFQAEVARYERAQRHGKAKKALSVARAEQG